MSDNLDADKLVDLLYQYFDKRGISDVEIKEYKFDFEFHFDTRGLELSKLNTILTTLKELNKGVLIEYSVEVQLFDPKLTVYFDRYDDGDYNEEEIKSGTANSSDEDDLPF